MHPKQKNSNARFTFTRLAEGVVTEVQDDAGDSIEIVNQKKHIASLFSAKFIPMVKNHSY